ncbi:phosphotransferase [Thermopolyspora sp. NPDC052614]|uniref:phosphotransferase n=1 Tax=Thermopolyspora sp. NPDC052614 TaxID=3155682 RepID=UPI003440091A
MIAGPPESDVVVPAPVLRAATGRTWTVGENEVGGLTFRLGDGPDRRFVKWTPVSSGIDLRAEADRLRWAADFIRVPRVLDLGADEDGCWLVTAGLPGDDAVADRWKSDPATAVAAIGSGLRAQHPADARRTLRQARGSMRYSKASMLWCGSRSGGMRTPTCLAHG